MKRSLRNTSKQAPLTPRIPDPPSPQSGERPTVTPGIDLRVEETLFGLLMSWKARAEFFEKKFRAEEQRFTIYRAKGVARGISKKLTPAHSDKVNK